MTSSKGIFMNPVYETGGKRMSLTNLRENRRGEWYVIVQFALLALIACGPRTVAALPQWNPVVTGIGRITGALIMAGGCILAMAGALNLGRNLTPFVCPKASSVLLERGAYRIVRHPIYSGLLQVSLGWALWVHGWLTLGYVVLLFVLFDGKARREEEWLVLRFPGYAAYRSRVRKLIPFIY
jgi:protein-S-isoprenylcysteine O-methyltransferase Ste14